MEKKCDCECHKLHPIPCMYCSARHSDAERELEVYGDTHDGNTEKTNLPGWRPPEGYPF